jgi:hypothetical protein
MKLQTGFQYQPIVQKFMGDNNEALDKLLAVKDTQYNETLQQNLTTENFINSSKPLGLAGENEYYKKAQDTYKGYLQQVVEKGDLENMGYEAKRVATSVNEVMSPILTNKKNYAELYEGLNKKESDGKINAEVKNYRLNKARSSYRLTKDPVTGKVNTFSGEVGADLFDYDKFLNDFSKDYQADGNGDLLYVKGPDGVDYLKTTNGTLVTPAEARSSLRAALANNPNYQGYIKEQTEMKTFGNSRYALQAYGGKDAMIAAVGNANSISESDKVGKATAMKTGKDKLERAAAAIGVDFDKLSDEEISKLISLNPSLLVNSATDELIQPYVQKLAFNKSTVSATMNTNRQKEMMAGAAAEAASALAPIATTTGVEISTNPVLNDDNLGFSIATVSKGLVNQGAVNSQFNLDNVFNNLEKPQNKTGNKTATGQTGGFGSFPSTKTNAGMTLPQTAAFEKLKNAGSLSPADLKATTTQYFTASVDALKSALASNTAQAIKKFGVDSDEAVALKIYKDGIASYPFDKFMKDYKGDPLDAGTKYKEYVEGKIKPLIEKTRNVPAKVIISDNAAVKKDIEDRFVSPKKVGDDIVYNPTTSFTSATFVVNNKKYSYDQLIEEFGSFNDFWSKASLGGRMNSTDKYGGAYVFNHTDGDVTRQIKVLDTDEVKKLYKASSTLGTMRQQPVYRKEEIYMDPRMQKDLFGAVIKTNGPIEVKSMPVYVNPANPTQISYVNAATPDYVYSHNVLAYNNGSKDESTWPLITDDKFAEMEQVKNKSNAFVNNSQKDISFDGRTVADKRAAEAADNPAN